MLVVAQGIRRDRAPPFSFCYLFLSIPSLLTFNPTNYTSTRSILAWYHLSLPSQASLTPAVMANLPLTPAQSSDNVNPPSIVLHQEVTPPRTPPNQSHTPQDMRTSQNQTASANAIGSAVSAQPKTIKEVKTTNGATIVIHEGGQLYECPGVDQ